MLFVRLIIKKYIWSIKLRKHNKEEKCQNIEKITEKNNILEDLLQLAKIEPFHSPGVGDGRRDAQLDDSGVHPSP